jgi:uncharacterized repeat protein (TIGR03803 family)
MRRKNQEMIHNLPRWAAPTTGWWRRFGILGLQLCLFWAATAMLSPAQDEKPAPDSVKFTTLVEFNGTDGGNPTAAPVQGLDGNLYGTAVNGGSGCTSPPPPGCGTFFKLTPSGTLTTVYNFCPGVWPLCADEGAYPLSSLTLGTDGNFYGFTGNGGTGAYCPSGPAGYCGTSFEITPGGALTTLYNWCSEPNCADGYINEFSGLTQGALIQGTGGNFYGATVGGGAYGAGTVFKLTPSGVLTTLYSFCAQSGCPDGQSPLGLVEGSDGNFYGTTQLGGAYGQGAVFKLTPSGALTTLYSFCAQSGCPDGAKPPALLIHGVDGNFYGTTTQGGSEAACHSTVGSRPPYPCGTLFQITPEGTLTTIYNFCSAPDDCPNGSSPFGALVQATDGNFYGEMSSGGTDGYGTIFRITPQGGAATLYSFDYNVTGFGYGLVQATNGSLYGATWGGGIGSIGGSVCSTGTCGTLFSLSVGLGPFVETLPTSSKVGAQIKILGTDLTGATSVSFNGVEAPFEVISHSLISATVPEGATTGFVTVTTSAYTTLKSNLRFQVRP